MTTLSEEVKKMLIGKEVKIKKSYVPDDWFLVVDVDEPYNRDGWDGAYVQLFGLHLKDAYLDYVKIGMVDEIEIRTPIRKRRKRVWD